MSVGWRGASCWVGAWDHVEVKMVTSEHLICVASPFAMVRAQGRPQLCSSAPFDYGIESTMTFERLLALRVSSADVFSPSSTPFYLARKRQSPFSPERRHQITAPIGETSSNSAIIHRYAISFAPRWALRPAPEGDFPSNCWDHSACSWEECSPPGRCGHTRS